MSQNALARKCGISSGYMSQLLNSRGVGPAIRARILAALPGNEFDRLFEEVQPEVIDGYQKR